MRKIFLYIFAAIFIVGGVMGIIKSLLPGMEWLSFRSLVAGNLAVAIDIPLYIRIYSVVMSILEIAAAIVIFAHRRRLLFWVQVILAFNMIGCVAAIVMGDMLAIVSLILRFIPAYIIERERRIV